MPSRPYLLLDVDGPLNPYRAKAVPPGYDFHEIQEGEKTWKLLLNQQHGVELNAIAQWVGDRPFVWIDDEVNRYDRFFLDSIDGLGRHLLHRVEPNLGLTRSDFAAVRAWAELNP